MNQRRSLLLRQFEPEDAEALFSILATPGVLDYFPPGPPPTLSTAETMIERIAGDWEEHGYGLWAVEIDGRLVGRGGLQYLPDTGEVEVDFIIAPEFWGLGIATVVGGKALRFGLYELGVSEIVGLVHPDNLASKRVLEKIGMTLDRRTEYFGMTVDRYTIDVPPKDE